MCTQASQEIFLIGLLLSYDARTLLGVRNEKAAKRDRDEWRRLKAMQWGAAVGCKYATDRLLINLNICDIL